MADTKYNAADQDVLIPIADLRFDLDNPRIPTLAFQSDEEAIRYLIDEYDVEELVQSILSSGWIDYEPLIVDRKSNIVYEGNRRAAVDFGPGTARDNEVSPS